MLLWRQFLEAASRLYAPQFALFAPSVTPRYTNGMIFARMSGTIYSLIFVILLFSFSQPSALADMVDNAVLIIRHAEKPAVGPDLSEAGEKRAQAYKTYFEPFKDDIKPFRVDYLIAAGNTAHSHRSVQTLEPLEKATGLELNSDFDNNDTDRLAEWLKNHDHKRHILICWHHGNIPKLINALGGDSAKVIGSRSWPEDAYNWVVELNYDSKGTLIREKKFIENIPLAR